jgi:hypothetical protein
MKIAILIASLLGLLAITVGWAVWGWQQTSNVPMSVHSYIAMILGIVFTLLVGCGLMALMFYSSRHGYDDAAGDLSDIEKDLDR